MTKFLRLIFASFLLVPFAFSLQNPAENQADEPKTQASEPEKAEAETKPEKSKKETKTAAKTEPAAAQNAPADTAVKPDSAAAVVDEKPVVTHHQITVNGKTLKYTATVAQMPIRNADGETEAHIFYIAYTLDCADGKPSSGTAGTSDACKSATAKRPLMFSFNGGPGSSSIWLHMGTIGPRRVKMLPDGSMPAPPFQLVDNEYTWLEQTDLVFIDPVGTGFSRPKTKELGKKFWGLRGDIESVAELIRMYISRNARWNSPLYVVGESYGTTRAAGLAGYLINNGIALNGMVLVSSILDFQTAVFSKNNDEPYVMYLPTYAATAWFHKKIAPEYQGDLRTTLKQAEQFAMGEYSQALAKGDSLTPEERAAVLDKLSKFTGLSKQYLDLSDLRVEHVHFLKELLRDQKKTLGRIDSRFTGTDLVNYGEYFEYDPSIAQVQPPYTQLFNQYVRTELNYQTDMNYNVFGNVGRWQWEETEEGGFPNTAEGLRSAFAKNPYMKVFIASGYYDLATPYYGTQYSLNHIGLDEASRKRISSGFYEAGHMMYINEESLKQLKKDVSGWMGR